MEPAKTMILRRWASRIRTEDRDRYVAYISETGVADYGATPGNLGCEMLLRDCGDGVTEVSMLSWWTSLDSIRGFAGDDLDRARYYPLDDHFLLEKPERVEHHVVVIDGLGLATPAAEQR